MTGFWVLVQKELLEQRRTKKFLALALVFTFLAVVPPTIFRTVVHFQEGAHCVEQAREALENIIGGMMPVFGTGVVIIIAMGALANERASGTAAMTLSKPVARSAFVAAKLLALGASIFGAVAVGGAVVYILTLILFADGGVGRFALGLLITSTYLWYVGAITLLISAQFSQQLLVGGIVLALFMVQLFLLPIPHTERYWPIMSPGWARSIFRGDGNDLWSAFAIAAGSIPLMGMAAWGIFRRKEL
ncbi:MAG: ABC transporter permease [Chloroflexi bacterium]|nr:ABC transporter permease [Chloroflexota bacterium]